MTAALMSISGFANAWAQAMLRATWQGGLALVLAWALCQTVARRSGRAQSWIWRLAFLKFAACLLLLAPLSLPLLPTPQQRSQPIAASIPTLPPPAPAAATALPQQTRASSPGAPSSPPASLLSPPSLVRPFWLLIPWCIGVLCVLVPFSLGYRDSRRLRRSGTPFANPHLTAMYSDLAGKFLIRPPPVLLSTASPLAPLLTGVFRPAILLPESLAGAPAERLTLILAHELAHARRRDIFWNQFHAAVTAIFFFHPLLWLARRPVRFAQELACDQFTLAITRARPADYASTLLDVLTLQNHLRRTPISVGVADSAGSMTRRLLAMKTFTPWSKRRLMASATCFTALAAIGLLPWRLVARASSPSAPASPAANAPVGTTSPAIEDIRAKIAADWARVNAAQSKLDEAKVTTAEPSARGGPADVAADQKALANAQTEIDEQKRTLEQDQISLMQIVGQAYAAVHPDYAPLAQIRSPAAAPASQEDPAIHADAQVSGSHRRDLPPCCRHNRRRPREARPPSQKRRLALQARQPRDPGPRRRR